MEYSAQDHALHQLYQHVPNHFMLVFGVFMSSWHFSKGMCVHTCGVFVRSGFGGVAPQLGAAPTAQCAGCTCWDTFVQRAKTAGY
eukprot:4416842-Amphidinium_carterae.1